MAEQEYEVHVIYSAPASVVQTFSDTWLAIKAEAEVWKVGHGSWKRERIYEGFRDRQAAERRMKARADGRAFRDDTTSERLDAMLGRGATADDRHVVRKRLNQQDHRAREASARKQRGALARQALRPIFEREKRQLRAWLAVDAPRQRQLRRREKEILTARRLVQIADVTKSTMPLLTMLRGVHERRPDLIPTMPTYASVRRLRDNLALLKSEAGPWSNSEGCEPERVT